MVGAVCSWSETSDRRTFNTLKKVLWHRALGLFWHYLILLCKTPSANCMEWDVKLTKV